MELACQGCWHCHSSCRQGKVVMDCTDYSTKMQATLWDWDTNYCWKTNHLSGKQELCLAEPQMRRLSSWKIYNHLCISAGGFSTFTVCQRSISQTCPSLPYCVLVFSPTNESSKFCFVRSWQRPTWPKRPAIIVIDSATYLLTISSPDIDPIYHN